ncbi:hypothetical protein KJ841_01185 [Patescibacteria group bacterium]|nr:hypothetical protein [Patescibacteria group bacterium]
MEIKKGTFVVVVKDVPEFGRVEEIDSESPPFIVKTESGQDIKCNKDVLIPLVTYCKSVQDGWQRYQPGIIKNLAIMIHDLQKQVSRLRSDSDNSAQTIMKTQEDLRKHQNDSKKHAIGMP